MPVHFDSELFASPTLSKFSALGGPHIFCPANAESGIQVFGSAASVIGTDNTTALTLTAVGLLDGATVDLQSNDFTGFVIPFSFDGSDPLASVLICNWWGSVAGPQNLDPTLPRSLYVPWATAPIAKGAGGLCNGTP